MAAWWRGWGPERLAAFGAMAGLAISVWAGGPVRTTVDAGTDLKTLYASAWCLGHGLNAYRFADLARVFAANGVVAPASWYGHAPVYPPASLVALLPLTWVGMVGAVYGWLILSALAMAAAVAAMLRGAGEVFGLGRGWRMGMLVAVASSPLLSFALGVGNVSVLVGAICVLAVTAREENGGWWRTTGLAVALVLKPHLAVWALVGLVAMPGRRRLGLRAGGLALGFAVIAGVAAWAQWGGFVAMVRSETAGGSMMAGHYERIPLAAQITAMPRLPGFWGPLGTWVALAVLGAGLLWAGWRARDAAARYGVMCGWLGLGLVASYHRAEDGVLLVTLAMPLMVRQLRNWWGMALLAGMVLLSVSPGDAAWAWLGRQHGLGGLAGLMIYRQAAVGALVLVLALTGIAVWKGSERVGAAEGKT